MQRKYSEDFDRKITKQGQNCKFQQFVWTEYILKTQTVLDHLPASNYAKFVESHEHLKADLVVYDVANCKFILQNSGLYSEGFGEFKRYRIN